MWDSYCSCVHRRSTQISSVQQLGSLDKSHGNTLASLVIQVNNSLQVLGLSSHQEILARYCLVSKNHSLPAHKNIENAGEDVFKNSFRWETRHFVIAGFHCTWKNIALACDPNADIQWPEEAYFVIMLKYWKISFVTNLIKDPSTWCY